MIKAYSLMILLVCASYFQPIAASYFQPIAGGAVCVKAVRPYPFDVEVSKGEASVPTFDNPIPIDKYAEWNQWFWDSALWSWDLGAYFIGTTDCSKQNKKYLCGQSATGTGKAGETYPCVWTDHANTCEKGKTAYSFDVTLGTPPYNPSIRLIGSKPAFEPNKYYRGSGAFKQVDNCSLIKNLYDCGQAVVGSGKAGETYPCGKPRGITIAPPSSFRKKSIPDKVDLSKKIGLELFMPLISRMNEKQFDLFAARWLKDIKGLSDVTLDNVAEKVDKYLNNSTKYTCWVGAEITMLDDNRASLRQSFGNGSDDLLFAVAYVNDPSMCFLMSNPMPIDDETPHSFTNPLEVPAKVNHVYAIQEHQSPLGSMNKTFSTSLSEYKSTVGKLTGFKCGLANPSDYFGYVGDEDMCNFFKSDTSHKPSAASSAAASSSALPVTRITTTDSVGCFNSYVDCINGGWGLDVCFWPCISDNAAIVKRAVSDPTWRKANKLINQDGKELNVDAESAVKYRSCLESCKPLKQVSEKASNKYSGCMSRCSWPLIID